MQRQTGLWRIPVCLFCYFFFFFFSGDGDSNVGIGSGLSSQLKIDGPNSKTPLIIRAPINKGILYSFLLVLNNSIKPTMLLITTATAQMCGSKNTFRIFRPTGSRLNQITPRIKSINNHNTFPFVLTLSPFCPWADLITQLLFLTELYTSEANEGYLLELSNFSILFKISIIISSCFSRWRRTASISFSALTLVS